MRHALLLLPFCLAACHKAPSRASVDQPPPPATRPALPTIPCTIAGQPQSCTVERIAGADGLILLLRHPDGGFRRLRVTTDGHGVAAADGAEPARVAIEGKDTIAVAIGGDTYRLPATVGGG